MKKITQLIVLFVLVYVNVHAQTTLLDQTMLTQESFGTFTPVSISGNQSWYFSSQYGAVCSGYAAGTSNENEDWLVGPVVNLEDVDNVVLTFSHTRGSAAVMNVGVTEGWYKAFVTSNYTGDPSTTNWIEFTELNQNVTTAWQFISSGNLVIPDEAKSANSRIAFRYISSATASATWEIKNIKITGEPQATNPVVNGTFKITNWNTEWLGCTENGPDDEITQLANVVTILRNINADVYCLQEVSNTAAMPTINSIVSQLGEEEWGGTIIPSDTGDCNQRQALIYKKARVQFVSSFELSSGSASQGNSYNYNWSGGRYPAVYNVNFIAGNNVVPVTLVNIHAKAEDNNASSYTRRLGASTALKTILDSTSYNTKNVVIIGDYNDYLDGTTSTVCECTDSPYKNFMDDTTNYRGITSGLASPIIENIIVSDELSGNYVPGSVLIQSNVVQTVSGYYFTTSNHLPVSASFLFSTMDIPNVIANNVWSIYPNPVKDALNINVSGVLNDSSVQVYDIMGRQVFSGTLSGNTLNVTTLPSGMYVLKMDGKTGKFIKQ